MKRVLIVINGYAVAQGVEHQIKRLTEEFLARGVEVDVRKNTDILAYIDGEKIVHQLPPYDFVVYLDKDRYVAGLLEKSGYKLFNSEKAISLCDDKMLTHVFLSKSGIKMPKTISSNLCYHDNGYRGYLDKIIETIGLPMIVKENYGSLGRQVYLIKTKEELIEIENRLIHVPHLFQELVTSSVGMDYRLIVIGGKVVAMMKRENKHSYLSNLATGGTATKVELPQPYIDIAEKAAKLIGLDYCGVDILKGKDGEPVLSEVNSNAFYEGIEKATHVNVAGSYVDYLLSK